MPCVTSRSAIICGRIPNVARAYEAEKRRARALHPDNSHVYTDEKSAWICMTEATALAWHAERNVGARDSN